MAQVTVPEPLAPELVSRLGDFARACKAAARAVSLYPQAHPAIQSALARLAEGARRTTSSGSFTLTVLPDALLVEGRAPARPDAAMGELAALLHEHTVGAMTIHPGADAETWRSFLLLLARPSEDVRREGGIARLWNAGAPHQIEVVEIDYAAVLRERSAPAASWEDIVANCLQGDAIELNEEAVSTLLDIAGDATRMADLAALVEEHAGQADGARGKASALLRMLRGVVDLVTRRDPGRLEAVLDNMAAALGALSAESVAEFLRQRPDPDVAGTVDLVGELTTRMADETVARFVARSVVSEGAASARLVEAFQALVPGDERRHRLVQTARDEAAQSALTDDESFDAIWGNVAEMLTSYSDKTFVSDSYGRELTGARSQAIEVERVNDDPPERIARWLSTVNDGALRALDLELLVDLLAVETDPVQWRAMTEPVVCHVEDLLLVGDFESAKRLVEAVLREAGEQGAPARRVPAAAAVERLVQGSMMRHIVSHLSTLDDSGFEQVKSLCHAIGGVVIQPLAEALSVQERDRPRRRLTDLLISFGALGRQSVERLKNSANGAVRRTAVYLLREFGGSEALPDLALLLDDAEPNVQREAIRAIVAIATNDAYAVLKEALASGTSSSRSAIMQVLGAIRDERAAPLFCYIVSHVDHRGPLRDVYLRAIEALGVLRDETSVAVLKEALHRGEWYAPFRTAGLRQAAAAALARIGTADATTVLQEAAGAGARGVRAAARGQLGRAARNAKA